MGATDRLLARIRRQHVSLPVAASIAFHQLVPNSSEAYDAERLGELQNLIARALSKVVPLHALDRDRGTLRQLDDEELQGARFKRGATLLVVDDGRVLLSNLWMLRGDLKEAVAILTHVGIAAIAPGSVAPHPPPAAKPQEDQKNPDSLLARLEELEKLLRAPLPAGQLQKANKLAVSIARNAPNGGIANLAMLLMSAANESRHDDPVADDGQFNLALLRLRLALQEAKRNLETAPR